MFRLIANFLHLDLEWQHLVMMVLVVIVNKKGLGHLSELRGCLVAEIVD